MYHDWCQKSSPILLPATSLLRRHHRRLTAATLLLLLTSLSLHNRTARNANNGSLILCDRPTPRLSRTRRPPVRQPKKLLLLQDPSTLGGASGNLGNQMTAVLHAFDFARDHEMDLGVTLDSWPLQTLSSLFMKQILTVIHHAKPVTASTVAGMLEKELGITLVRQPDQTDRYQVVAHRSAHDLRHYQTPLLQTHWRQVRDYHVYILQTLFINYNQGNGYDIERVRQGGLRLTPQMCSTLQSLFGEAKSYTPYTVIHLQLYDRGAGTMATLGHWMTADYLRSILTDTNMLKQPVVLLSDGSTLAKVVEGELTNDPLLAAHLQVLGNGPSLNGAEVMLAILSNVFVGSPSSATAVLIARSRYALGYRGTTYMFDRERVGEWREKCEDDCVFHPSIMQEWT